MATKEKKVNKPLVAISILAVLLFGMVADPYLLPTEPIGSFGEFIAVYAIALILIPVLNFWFKALWNNIVPLVFGFREINYWESLGLIALISLMIA